MITSLVLDLLEEDFLLAIGRHQIRVATLAESLGYKERYGGVGGRALARAVARRLERKGRVRLSRHTPYLVERVDE